MVEEYIAGMVKVVIGTVLIAGGAAWLIWYLVWSVEIAGG